MVLNGAIYNQSIPIFNNEMDSDLFGANSTILFHTILQYLAHLGSIRYPSTPLGTISHLSVLLCTIGNHLGTIWYNSSIIWYHWASFSTIGHPSQVSTETKIFWLKPRTYQEEGFSFGSWFNDFRDYWLLVRYLVLRFSPILGLTRNSRPQLLVYPRTYFFNQEFLVTNSKLTNLAMYRLEFLI